MKALRRRLQRLERRADTLAVSQAEAFPDEALAAWCRGGCVGSLPPAGPRPAKYRSEEEWQQSHRFLLALCCRAAGRADPPGMTAEECCQVEDTLAFFASLDPEGQLTLPQQARLAPYAGVIEPFLSDAGGGIVPAGRQPASALEPPTGPPLFPV